MISSPRRPLSRLVTGLLACATLSAPAATLTAPPVVLFGKVLHLGQGAAYQVYQGRLSLTLARDDDPDHVVVLETALDRIGPAGEVSYRLEIPVKHLPSPHELKTSVAVGFDETSYRFESIALDDQPAMAVEASQRQLLSSFARRAVEHRLDLEVNLPQTDSDKDRMPDWWELRHGLNPHLAIDAQQDLDQDQLNNLDEFLAGTDPTVSNTKALVQTTHLHVPQGGTAGFHVGIIDLDTPPTSLRLGVLDLPDGLTLRHALQVLPSGESFPYSEILAGRVQLDVAPSFVSGSLTLTVADLETNITTAVVRIESFSPATAAIPPTVWLDAASLTRPGPVSEWSDRSGNQHDAYQADPNRQPLFFPAERGAVRFNGQTLLFLDQRDLEFESMTAFVAARITSSSPEDQTLFRSGPWELSIGGANNPHFAESFQLSGLGRPLRGPLAADPETRILTLGGQRDHRFLGQSGGPLLSLAGGATNPAESAALATLGARQGVGEASANSFLNGSLHEVLLYESAIPFALRTRNEDYLGSRWGEWVVWDYREQVASVSITGSLLQPNALTGGWGEDSLTGGERGDILRGGPGDDRLTGRGGPDRFQFFPGDGNDIVSDFHPESGDSLDFSGIFSQAAGNPADFVRIRLRVTRGADNLPRVDAAIELDHDGPIGGRSVDQTITLENASLDPSRLAQLLGEGAFHLGALRFPTHLEITAASDHLLENGLAQTINVTRTGNLEGALDLDLSFTGDAAPGVDYTVNLPGDSSSVRTLRFERGQSIANFAVMPIPDRDPETERVVITAMDDLNLDLDGVTTLDLALRDIPHFLIETTRHAQSEPDPSPGLLRVSRFGPGLEAFAEIPIDYRGPLADDNEAPALPARIVFHPGEAEVTLAISPGDHPAGGSQLDYLVAHLHPDRAQQFVDGTGAAEVLLLPSDAVTAPPFRSWLASYFPGNPAPDLASQDADGDGTPNLFEYVRGTSPVEPDPTGTGRPVLRVLPTAIEVSLDTTLGWTDLDFALEGSVDLRQWSPVPPNTALTLTPIGHDRVRRTYSIPRASSNMGAFRAVAVPVPLSSAAHP